MLAALWKSDTIISNVSISDVSIGDASVSDIILMIALLIIFALLFILFCLACTVFTLPQAIKRLHDLNKSGWHLLFLLTILIPLIGKLFILAFALYLFIAEGTAGPNRFGPDPLGRNPAGSRAIYETKACKNNETSYATETYEGFEAGYEEERRER